ncbi:membrane protein [Loktanella atrilutea]|uniref:Membrane protein n=1 Tax=Loktanella atrilutea TaxID=366533 RepID=A0A1M4U348_LOKAT|nr:YihY/virulence factor BrkB family protein [Loktanella atrilutea]SHE51064.1 membrane protein [Loktanella atrilutea]
MPDTATSPKDISAKGWLATTKRVVASIGSDHVTLIAAGCAFYGLLALFPGVVAAMALAGLFTDPTGLVDQLQTLTRFMPQEAAQIVIDQAKSVAGSDSGGLGLAAIIGLLTSFWSASAAMAALIEGLNVAFGVSDTRSYLRATLARLVLTLLAVLGFFVIVLTLVAIPVVLRFVRLDTDTEWLVLLIRWPVVLLLLATGLAVIYRYAPARRRRAWRWITPGAAFACILWLAGSVLFAWYVQNFATYNETFGTLGGVIVLLMWLWLSSFIVLLGAEVDSEIEAQGKQNPSPATGDADTADSNLLDQGSAALIGSPKPKAGSSGSQDQSPARPAERDPTPPPPAKLTFSTVALLAGALLLTRRGK